MPSAARNLDGLSRRSPRGRMATALLAIGAGCWTPPGQAQDATASEPPGGEHAKIEVVAGPHVLDAHRSAIEDLRAHRTEWTLPRDAGRVVAALLAVAAAGELDDLTLALPADARWGLPDRRELLARPIFDGDHGHAFLRAFVDAAVRFDEDESVECPPLVPALHLLVDAGAEPLWCVIRNDEGLDLLVFRLRVLQGRPWIDYVGFFEQRPVGPVRVPGGDPPPPISPPILEE